MNGYDLVPGVPGAGHVAANGYWHPGRSTNCTKTPCNNNRKGIK